MPIRILAKKWSGALRRRLGISGPSKKDREILGTRLKRRESWAERFGLAVGIGLIIEYWDDIHDCVIHWHAPPLPLTGGLLVTAGVFGEVLFSRLVLRTSEKIQELADSEVSQANRLAAEALERAAKAEQATAEANLARVQLETRMAARTISDSERREIVKFLSASAGKTVDIVVFDHHIQETKLFAHLEIFGMFVAARWKCRIWESRAVKYRIPGASLLIVIGEGKEYFEEFKHIASGLAEILKRSGVDCDVSGARFGCKGEFTPGDFHLDGEHPRQFMGQRIVAPFRIQIGAKQVVPPVSIPTVTLRAGSPDKGAG